VSGRSRRRSDAAERLLENFKRDVSARWLPRLRWMWLIVAATILAVQCFVIIRDVTVTPSRLISVFAFMVAMASFWRHREGMVGDRRASSSLVTRWFSFPGYLLSLSIAFAAVAFWFLKAMRGAPWDALLARVFGGTVGALLSASAIFYLGHRLAKRSDDRTWNAIAPAWALMFLVCIPVMSLPSGMFRATVTALSQRLDEIRVFHLVEGSQLRSIESGRLIDVADGAFLTGFLFFGIACLIAFWRRWSTLYGAILLPCIFIIGLTIEPLMMFVGGMLDPHITTSDESKATSIIRAITFAGCGMGAFSLSGLLTWLLGTMNSAGDESHVSRSRRSEQWNHWATVALGPFMSGIHDTEPADNYERSTFAKFSRQYFQTRKWRFLVLSIPSIAFVVWCAGWTQTQTTMLADSMRLTSYQKRFAAEINKRDLQRSTWLVQRLLQMAPLDSTPTFQLATLMIDAGQADLGQDLMNQLLKRSPGHADAHLWLAQQSLRRFEGDPKTADDIEMHLVAAMNGDVGAWEPRYAYALFLASQGRTQEASRTLSQSRAMSADAELRVATLQHRLGKTEDAMRRAERVLQQANANASKTTPPTVEDYMQMAEAHALRGDLQNAASSLESANKLGPNDQVEESLVRTLLTICHLPTESAASRFDRLTRALEINAQHPDVMLLCAKWMFNQNGQVDARTIELSRRTVTHAATSGTLTASAHVVLGTGAAAKGNLKAAQTYLSKAYDMGDRSPVLLNNLAWVRFTLDQSSASDCLGLVCEAIKQDPKSLDALTTRAEIYTAMGKFADAIVDLEKAVQITGPSAEMSRQLADLYEKSGDHETAAIYRKSAK
jgi:tetratricopeptide (TPR) repeat protein